MLLKSEPQYGMHSEIKQVGKLFDASSSRLSVTYDIINFTGALVWCRDRYGDLDKISSSLNRVPGYGDKAIVIRARTVLTPNAVTRKVNRYSSAYVGDSDQTFSTERYYTITKDSIESNGVVYIPEIDMHFSRSRSVLSMLQVDLPSSGTSPHITESIKESITRSADTPLAIVLNDPSKTIDRVYTIINNNVYPVTVGDDLLMGQTCVVRFNCGSKDLQEEVGDFYMSDLIDTFKEGKSFNVECSSGHSLQLYETVEQAREVLYRRDLKQEQDLKYSGLAHTEKKKLQLEHDKVVTGLKEELLKTKEDLDRVLREREINLENAQMKLNCSKHQTEVAKVSTEAKKVAFEKKKIVVDRKNLKNSQAHARAIQDKQIKKEEARVVSSSAGAATSVAKLALVAVPIVAGLVTLAVTKMGISPAVMLKLGPTLARKCLSSVLGKVASGAGKVCAGVAGLVGSAISTGMDYVSSAVGWCADKVSNIVSGVCDIFC